MRHIVKANAVDMAQEGIIAEVKRLQVPHSKRKILLPMVPRSINGKYVQNEVAVLHQSDCTVN